MIYIRIKGAIAVLIVVFIIVAGAVAVLNFDNLLVAPAPVQVYEPTMPSDNERIVCLAFDDGWKSHLEVASILESYNFKATFPIITSYVGYPAYLDWSDIRSLAQKGNDIVSHTVTHRDLSWLDSASLHAELADSREALRSKGYAADVLIYPYGVGDSNDMVRNAVAEYYLLARGTETGKCNLTGFDRYDVGSYGIYRNTTMVEFASYLNGTQGSTITILYYHQVSDEDIDTAISKDTFQAQMQYLKDNGYTVRTISEQFLKESHD